MGIAWQILLVSNMIGIESHLAMEFVSMVTNLRALDVPMAYTTLPSFVAAVLSGFLIVGLSYVSEKYATSNRGKALLLVLINAIQFTGAILIIIGNMIKLLYYNDTSWADPNNSSAIDKMEDFNNISSLNSSTKSELTYTSSDALDAKTLVAGSNYSSYNGSLCPGDASDESVHSLLPFPFYAVLVMLGYALAESGFDAGNCFLRTYLLAYTSSHIHSSVLVKSAFMGSFGGLFTTLLGSLSIGEWLTTGTQYNVDAVRTMFIAGFAFTLGVITLSMSLIAGMTSCCNPPQTPQTENVDESAGYEITTNEKKKLLAGAILYKTNDGEVHLASYDTNSKSPSSKDCLYSNQHDTGTLEEAKSNLSVKELVRILRRNFFRICLCAGALFACWAVFSFNLYSVNFVGVAIYNGDSSAPANSDAYKTFLKGERAGSIGLLLVYLSYMSIGSLQNLVLEKFGWWTEVSLLSVVYIVINFCCAYFLKLWLFYLAACLSGLYRVVIYTIPYLLITRTSESEQNPNKEIGKSPNKNVDIAIVAALWPSSFLVAAAITGPIMSATGNAATSVYATTTVATIALVFYFLIRKL